MANKTKLKRAIRKQLIREQSRSSSPAGAPSKQSQQGLSPWHAQPAAKRRLLEKVDNFAPLRNGLRRAAMLRGDWAGIPMPLEGERLVVESTYPKAMELMAMGGSADECSPPEATAANEADGLKLVNTFWSTHKRCDILVIKKADGKVSFGVTPGVHHFKYDMRTLGCAEAWGIEQESTAVQLLAEMVDHRKFKQYMLTGMFLERSKRSGVFYMFRRLKPTVAIRAEGDTTRILCALCMHPIAYYQGSWAGAMCPTDDVVAHLSMMRADEPMFWRRANHHPAWRPEAGL